MKEIIWLDPKLDSDENITNFNKLNQIRNVKIIRIKTINQTLEKLNEILFKETFIIVNSELYNEFIDEFKENKNNICFIPKIIIFNPNEKDFLDSKNKNMINHPFYNSGGVETDFNKVIQYIKNPKKYTQIFLKREDEGQLSFDYIDTKEKLALPLMYKYLIEFNERDMKLFLNIYIIIIIIKVEK